MGSLQDVATVFSMRIQIRAERTDDASAVRAVNMAAFEGLDEADLVDRLRERARPFLAWVAVVDGEIAGHIAFSPVTLVPPQLELDIRGLGPMAVAPRRQRAGIGSSLVRSGLEGCRASGADAVVVVGHPDYYPRFGFEPAASRGLDSTFDIPPEAFMVLELVPGALRGVRGTVCYDPAFDY